MKFPGDHLTPSLRRRLCDRYLGIFIDADLSMRSHAQRTVDGCLAILRQLRSIRGSVPSSVFPRRWSSPLCCPGWITVMLRWLAYQPICLIFSSLCSTLLLGRWLDCDDQTTSLTLLPVFTGCVLLNASSLNLQSLSTEVYTALHLGICLICCTAFQTSHRDAVSGRQPPLNWSSLCRVL